MRAFESLLAERDVRETQAGPDAAVEALLAFFADVRADDAAVDGVSDVVYLSWGTYDWGPGPTFQYSIRRQFFVADTRVEDADDGIWELEWIFHFVPDAKTVALGSGSVECSEPRDVEAFHSRVRAMAPSEFARRASATRTELSFRQGG